MMVQSRSPQVGILSYNAGNTGSLQCALTRLNITSKIIEKPEELEKMTGIIFPGAGAAGTAMQCLRETGWVEAIQSCKKPFLGLCLGMQLLFEFSEEDATKCLGIFKGRVTELPDTLTKPHMGWNMLRQAQHDNPIGYAYFVHSFVCEPTDPSVTTMRTAYGDDLCAGVQQGNFFGVQWHPEKSGDVGDRYLLSFSELCK